MALLHKPELLKETCFSESTNSEPGAVATGSEIQRRTPSDLSVVARQSPLECLTRSLRLPVLYLSTHD